ncbi:hypothetical protein AKJ16_DCAP20236, partial [Drosera capensis]
NAAAESEKLTLDDASKTPMREKGERKEMEWSGAKRASPGLVLVTFPVHVSGVGKRIVSGLEIGSCGPIGLVHLVDKSKVSEPIQRCSWSLQMAILKDGGFAVMNLEGHIYTCDEVDQQSKETAITNHKIQPCLYQVAYKSHWLLQPEQNHLPNNRYQHEQSTVQFISQL